MLLIKHDKSFHHLYVLIVLLLLMKLAPGFISGVKGATFGCIERERQALLKFKEDLIDDFGILSTWGSEEEKRDCCKWRGVGCNNRTGHVTHLDLHRENGGKYLTGKISNSLLELQHLSYLNLSGSNFEGNPFPYFIGSLKELTYLDLSSIGVTGTLSNQPWNLSKLQSLDLSYNYGVNFKNLNFLSNLFFLEYLYLDENNLSQATEWIQTINKFPFLKVLWLSGCDLSSVSPPSLSFTNSSKSLAVIDLSQNYLASSTFNWLSNFNNSLVHLNLRSNWINSSENLDWLSYLSSLEYLDLSRNNLSQTIDWLQVLNRLPRLHELLLSSCSLSIIGSPSLSLVNSSKSLALVDFSDNQLTSSIFYWLANFGSNLVDIYLSYNQLQGSIPDAFTNMTSLRTLHLSSNQLQGYLSSFGHMCSLNALYISENNLTGELSQLFQDLHGCLESSLEILQLDGNQLQGSLPDITRFASMTELDLSRNQLNGSLPKQFSQRSKLALLYLDDNQLTGSLTDVTMLSSLRELWIDNNRLDGNVSKSIGSLFQLEELHVGGNSLQGVMSEAHFSNLSKLTVLDLTDNSLALKFESNWAPSFQLVHIFLSSCNLGPHFPQWLRNQNNFVKLDISDSGISDTIPNWFWNLSNSKLELLDLSHNKMSGILPDFASKYSNLQNIDLSFNQFVGPLPLFSSDTTSTLFLSNNKFSGPASLPCNIGSDIFSVLDLSNNLLTEWIPDCLMNFTSLRILNLASNNFSDKIPSFIGSMFNLETLSLHNNSFVGELPSSLRNCSSLVFLDLSSNKLRGEIPGWIGESMPSLEVLSLQSNGFNGSIPPNLCHLSSILILDLSLNNITGIIPKCLNNLTSMVQKTESEYSLANNAVLSLYFSAPGSYDRYQNKIRVGWKGREDDYGSTLGLLRIINFARNKLIGEIPEEITGLLLLLALNLSGNNLTGEIPQNIGQLKQLESLDLSGNQLSGVIPITMADLNFLAFLNLSNNHLSGRIPFSTQLQGFNASQFTGNLALCGKPLLQKCPGDETNQSPPANDDNRGKEFVADEFMKWFCTAMGIGFSVFFWGVSGALLLKRSWRHAYFRFLDESWDWLYVKVAVRKARLQRAFQRLHEHVLA
ncbi:PREDICTED: LRR receptor-like serine/threonine-protein kinase FLS2 isoform X2 [Populus euphratica]|uniref:LRR receptor-like serine/threonine-protein kinase FLS2 isoform X2 n=1 Tax=Populus euphratica TaxID=75702 RepID=A0AAJ6X9G3_POPEU|nr:PREDICTED: LRR receptor-like serine/threonine-protein kinase FLS2 isoform X2 [Populus euphratica]